MVDKAKRNIKCLDTSINVTHDSSTSHLFISFSTLAATAKHAAVAAAQAYVFQAKTTAQARTSFLANIISQLHQTYDLVIKDRDDYSPADCLIFDHSLTIGGVISTHSNGPSLNHQVFDPAA